MIKTRKKDLFAVFFSTLLFLGLSVAEESKAQLERTLADDNPSVELTFMAPKHINLYTTELLSRGEFHYSIMHTFGEINSGYQNLWGIDNGANVRFYFEYGLNDRTNLAFSRTSQDKLIQFIGRRSITEQKRDSGSPVSVNMNLSIGVNTSDLSFLADSYSFSDRLNYTVSLSAARKFSERLSILISPVYTHFARTGPEVSIDDPDSQNYLSATGGFRYNILPRAAITVQSVVPISNPDLTPNLGIGFDVETGGHVFQMFFTTSRALNEPYLIAGENGTFLDSELRFGFNINRLFKLHD